MFGSSFEKPLCFPAAMQDVQAAMQVLELHDGFSEKKAAHEAVLPDVSGLSSRQARRLDRKDAEGLSCP